jgi:MoxR-like ATPase
MQNDIQRLLNAANQVILGKDRQIRLAVCCLLARGHLLIEDIPGVGKTTLAHTLAKLLGMQYQRIQFTSDILPADIIGASVFDAKNHEFKFHAGPIFNQMVLADEINRSTPKAQSALLEAMEEQQVTVEGVTYPLPEPFFVIATQNPSHQIGTFPLPESQLDRFLMRIELGYPDPQSERQLLTGVNRHHLIQTLSAQLTPQQLQQLQQAITQVHVSNALLNIIADYHREPG